MLHDTLVAFGYMSTVSTSGNDSPFLMPSFATLGFSLLLLAGVAVGSAPTSRQAGHGGKTGGQRGSFQAGSGKLKFVDGSTLA